MTPSVLDFTNLIMCANKVRKSGYYAPDGYDIRGQLKRTWIPNVMTTACKYDRKQIDPACAAAKCPRIGGEG